VINLVSVSGGKDSTATLLLALATQSRETVRAVFADTGNEHPLTYEYVDYLERTTGVQIHRLRQDFSAQIARKAEYVRTHWADKGVPQEHIDRVLAVLVPSGNPFLDLCIWKGRFPSRMAQFCTRFLKTEPIAEYALDLIDQSGEVYSWQGVRADESPSRAKLRTLQHVGDGFYNYRPILRWSVDDVFAMHRRHGINPNPLYSMGMRRVGCMPCINTRKDELLEISKRFPEVIDRIDEWERACGEAAKNGVATFFAGSGDKSAMTFTEIGNQYNIRRMIDWAQTSRGGKQFDLLRVTDEPLACSSAYGLCE
jgi:3'-phosphoadenosine 5'-phosphosulfate sulfotransferase (PAPS reductase)/FAD synthetase